MSFIFNGENWRLDEPDTIPALLFTHLYIVGLSLLIALVIAFAFSFLIVRFEGLYLPVITSAGVLYTLPSLAVLAFLIPFTGVGDLTLIIPLVAYAQIVLIRNIIAGIRAVDPTIVEVGRAMGMSERQLQLRVVLPLALPVIVAGIRVAAVTNIGIATIGFVVNVKDLGWMIFEGNTFVNASEVQAGAILATALALTVDLLLLAVQRSLNRGREVSALQTT
jgi:osmoprotectant transport system permease protein